MSYEPELADPALMRIDLNVVGHRRFRLKGKVKDKIAAVSVGIYCLGLVFHGLVAEGKNPYGFDGYRGFYCLLVGWTTFLESAKLFVPWTANIFYAVGFLILFWHKRPMVLGCLIPAAGLFIAVQTVHIDSVLVNAAGHRVPVEPGLGAWLWMASFIVLIAGFVLRRQDGSPTKS